MLRKWIILNFLLLSVGIHAQRQYSLSSVLSSRNWLKIATRSPGIYKVDAATLKALEINTGNISSTAIRLFGNGGNMLPENCSGAFTDDLAENAIQVFDGGDGLFNGTDYFLFYSNGPEKWLKDSINHQFKHQKNLYDNQSFYFITIAGTGKRIISQTTAPTGVLKINSFNERYFHELDTINLLTSGKEWYGEEFASSPGNFLTRNFTVPTPNADLLTPALIVSNCIGRSVGKQARFQVNINNTLVLQHRIAMVGAGNQDIFAIASEQTALFTPAPSLSISYTYQSESPGASGWLNWFELFTRQNLVFSGTSQLLFRDWNSVAPGNSGEFIIQSAVAATQVWDVTVPSDMVLMKTQLNGNTLKFSNDCASLHEYVAVNPASYLIPVAVGKIENQNLHASPPTDMVIITLPGILQEARRLAQFHTQKDNLKVLVVTADQVYNEFASGSHDPTAIRDFVKMLYDRATGSSGSHPKYLLLFGDASYDYKNRHAGNTNFVPAYESSNSLDPLGTFTSDDYFGFLDDTEDINNSSFQNILDLGIGRIPAKNMEEARSYVDKLFSYGSPAALGPWRTQLSLIADDEDYNLHFNDAEQIAATATATNPEFIQHKIYLDAYRQQSNSSGGRYPIVNQAINNQVENGTLIWNYNGHGGFRRLAEEVILDQAIVGSWKNSTRLPLFITATCDFAPYDNAAINSLGENILLRPKTGAIALMTTTRLVFAYSNLVMNRNYMQTILQKKPDGSYPSLGDATRTAKNITYQSQGDIINNLKFTLLGDPALTIAFPRYKVQTNTVNGAGVSSVPDTLKASKRYTIAGSVTDNNGNSMNNFNGTVYTTVYDKAKAATTLANDPSSNIATFQVQENIVYKGKATVKNGQFTFNFLVPQDIDYRFGAGKISYYAENGEVDANGIFTNFIIGGSAGVNTDKQGPEIKAYLNDEAFTNGGTTAPDPLLILKLSDSSGINILGTAIDHDITVTIDDDPARMFILNDFFEPVLDSYQSGIVRFPLPAMEEGKHTLKIKAWDAVNNSSEATANFMVAKNPLSIVRVLNFPNPVNLKTTFRFEHNLAIQDAEALISIYTVSGQLVKSIKRTINTGGNRSSDIDWDRKDDFGAHVLGGIYIFRLRITTSNGTRAEKSGKMVIH